MRDSQQACVYTQFKSIEKPSVFYSKYFFFTFVSFEYVIQSYCNEDILNFKKQKLKKSLATASLETQIRDFNRNILFIDNRNIHVVI